MNPAAKKNCAEVLEDMDWYLDNELDPSGTAEVSSHLERCESCSAERDTRMTLKNRLRSAVHGIPAPQRLEQRVRASLRSAAPAGKRFPWQGPLMALAASLVIFAGAAVAYQAGYLRLTRASQRSYYLSLSNHVNGLMKDALADHIHCAFFRKYPKNSPSLAQMIGDMGPDYKPLIDVVKQNIPGGYRVEQAHRCTVEHRNFVHLIAKSGSNVVSLVITRKHNGETFARQASTAVLSATGQPVYQASAQRFDMAAFETRDHLVYVVSNLDEQTNLGFLTAFAPGIQGVLHGVEGS